MQKPGADNNGRKYMHWFYFTLKKNKKNFISAPQMQKRPNVDVET